MHTVKYIHFEHDSLVNFDKCLHLYHHQTDEEVGDLRHSQNFPQAALQSVLLIDCPRQSVIWFLPLKCYWLLLVNHTKYEWILVLPGVGHHIKQIVHYVLFVSGFFSLSAYLWDSATLLHYGGHKNVLLRALASGDKTDQGPRLLCAEPTTVVMAESLLPSASSQLRLHMAGMLGQALSCEKQDFLTSSFGSRTTYWPGQNLLRTLVPSEMILTQSFFFSSLLHRSHLLTLASSSYPSHFSLKVFSPMSLIMFPSILLFASWRIWTKSFALQ